MRRHLVGQRFDAAARFPRGAERYLFLVVLGAASLLSAFEGQTVWDGVYTAEQATRGAEVYANLCASCHGLALTGGESAPPLTGGEFTSNWSGLTAGDLFDRIRTTMPADKPGTLTRARTASVLANILYVGGFPAGQTELPTQSEFLKQIRIEAVKKDAVKK